MSDFESSFPLFITNTARISLCVYKIKIQWNQNFTRTWAYRGLYKRESEWKPSNSLAKKKSYELNFQ